MSPLSIVMVCWNSGSDVEECAASLARAREELSAEDGAAIELVVVDNASDRFDEAAVTTAFRGARILRLDRNTGFGPGVNAGANLARGDVLLILNPDTRAERPALAELARRFEADATLAALAPRLTGPAIGDTGESQESFQLRHLPTLGSAARELLLVDRAFPNNRWRRTDRYLDRDRGTEFDVEQPAAAALAVRRKAFEAVGGFDSAFAPAYFEDVDLCRRLRAVGRIVYFPTSAFHHRGGAASAALGYARFLPLYYRQAVRYWRKSEGALRTLVFRGLVVVGMALRIALLPFRPAHSRTTRESLRAYAGAIVAAVKSP